MKKISIFLVIFCVAVGYLCGMEEKLEIEEQVEIEQSNVPSLKTLCAETLAKQLINDENLATFIKEKNHHIPTELDTLIAKKMIEECSTLRLSMLSSHFKSPFIIKNHTGIVNSVNFNHDETILASIDSNKKCFLYNCTNPADIKYITELSDTVSVVFNPSFNIMATINTEGVVNLYTIDEFKLVHFKTINDEQFPICGVVFNPEGTLLATVREHSKSSVMVFNLAHLEAPKFQLESHCNFITSMIFSPKGNYLALTTRDDKIWIYNLNKPKSKPYCFTDHKTNDRDTIQSVSFSPDGSLFLVVCNNTFCVYEMNTDVVDVVPFRRGILESVNITFDNSFLITTSNENTLSVYTGKNLKNMQKIADFTNEGLIKLARLNPNKTMLAIANSDNSICFYDVSSLHVKRMINIHKNHNSTISTVNFSSNGTLMATGSDDNTVCVYNLKEINDILTSNILLTDIHNSKILLAQKGIKLNYNYCSSIGLFTSLVGLLGVLVYQFI